LATTRLNVAGSWEACVPSECNQHVRVACERIRTGTRRAWPQRGARRFSTEISARSAGDGRRLG
jgi:hypothetical protein